MVVRTLSSLLIVLCVLIAAHLARPVTFAGMQLGEGSEVVGVDDLSEDSSIQIGDRIIAVNGRAYTGSQALAKRVSPWDQRLEVRVASLENARSESLRASQLHQELPDILQPTNYLLSIGGQPAYGESASTVARILQDYDQVTVVAVPTENIQDQIIPLKRGWPPLMALIAGGVALLALFILWGGAPLLGVSLGLAAAGAALWLDVAYPVARIVGLVLLCLAAASGAWMFLQNTVAVRDRGQRAFRNEGGDDAESNLFMALQRAEEEINAPLYIVVGSAQQAVEIARDYERLVVTAADTVLTSTLSMLATEGGVFPRVDVGENVRDPWGDPLHDLDVSMKIAAAVPVQGYGSTADRWAFVIARTTDTPSSSDLLGQIAEVVDRWENTGVRESISMQATHGLLNIVRTSKSQPKSESSGASVSRASDLSMTATANPDLPLHSNLETVSEGVGVPRVMTREQLAQRGDTPSRDASKPSAQDSSTSSPHRSSESSQDRPQRSSLTNVSEGVGVPRVVTRKEHERSTSRTVGDAPADNDVPRQAIDDQPTAARFDRSQQDARAWAGHLARRLHSKYPVDDARYYDADDWSRLAPVMQSAAPSLFYGEAGAGKEFAVRSVLEKSQRADLPIAVIDCAELPESAVELELFGLKDDPGVVAGVLGGALILKSPLNLSSAMLRDIVERLHESDVRLFLVERQPGPSIALSSSATGELVKEHVGERIVRIPPLRERPGDVLRAAELMLEHFATMYTGGQRRQLTPVAVRLLESMELPANYWELESLMRSAVLRTDDDMIDVRSLLMTHSSELSEEKVSSMAREDEREQLVEMLHRTDGNKEDAARMLGLTVDALLRRLKRHGLM